MATEMLSLSTSPGILTWFEYDSRLPVFMEIQKEIEAAEELKLALQLPDWSGALRAIYCVLAVVFDLPSTATL